jgi:hypothetical protein
MNWNGFERGAVLGALEEASGGAMHVDDALPDTLIAAAEALGVLPIELRVWIYDQPKLAGFSPAQLASWARRMGFARNVDGRVEI